MSALRVLIYSQAVAHANEQSKAGGLEAADKQLPPFYCAVEESA